MSVFLLTISPRLELSNCFCTKGSFQLDLSGHLRGANRQGADALGRHALLSDWSRLRVHEVFSRSSGTISTKFVTQNVRGFTHRVRSSWMSAWRSRPVRDRPVAWCIQETHVSDSDEARALSLQWATLWGKHLATDHPPLSYWSTGSARAGGVAVLLTTESAQKATASNQELWNTRSISISINGLILLNIYAPSLRPAREQFFADLSR